MHSSLILSSKHKRSFLASFFLLFTFQWQAFAIDFPTPIKKCHFGDEKCLVEQGNNLLQRAATGIPERGIPPLEPLMVERIELLGDKGKALNVDLVMTDVEFHNYTQPTLKSIKGFSKDLTKPMTIVQRNINPRITVKSHYKIDGNMLVLPVKGEGQLTMVLDNVRSRFTTILKPQKRDDGKHYMLVEDMKIDTLMEKVTTDMTNLFNGDKVLSDSILNVINENWSILSDELTPKINEGLAQKLRELSTKFFKDIPYEDYFLPE